MRISDVKIICAELVKPRQGVQRLRRADLDKGTKMAWQDRIDSRFFPEHATRKSLVVGKAITVLWPPGRIYRVG